MTAKDLAKKIDGYRSLGPYVLLNAKEAKRVAVELRKANRNAKILSEYFLWLENKTTMQARPE